MDSLDALVCREIHNERFFTSVVHIELQVYILDRSINFRWASHISHWITVGGLNLNHASAQISEYGASAR